VKNGRVERPHARSAGSLPADHSLPGYSSLHPKKAAEKSAALLVFKRLSAFSVAIGADADADAGRVDADAAIVPMAAAFDVTLAAGRISV
jgi:hypothetical protein